MKWYQIIICATCGRQATVDDKGAKGAIVQGPDPCGCPPDRFEPGLPEQA